MTINEFKEILDSACGGAAFYTEAPLGLEPPYAVWLEKADSLFFGSYAVAEVKVHTGSGDCSFFEHLKEALAENGLVFSFDASFDEKEKVITRRAEICLPNAEIELLRVRFEADGIGRQKPVVLGQRNVPCVIIEETAERGGSGSAAAYKRITVRLSERLYDGEGHGLLWRGETPYTLVSRKKSVNGGMRQTDAGYLDLTFKEALHDVRRV